ncbi:MAG: VWA domain-containing protein [Vicinamibacterales bacterium]
MRTTLPALALAAAAFWTPTVGVAQAQAQDQRPTFRTTVERVTLSATVRTRHGKPVTDLTAEDFELVDSGVAKPFLDFRADRSPVRLALLMDVSGSMDVAAKRAAAQEAAWHLLSWLTAGEDEVSLYAFDRQIVEVEPPTPSPGQVLEKLDTLRPYGATSLFDAIAATGRAVAARGEGRRAVVVLTDGADNASRLTPAEVSGIASAIDVPVYIVVVVSPYDRAGQTTVNAEEVDAMLRGRLGDLARWTGGDIFAMIGSAQASLAARQIVTELRHQYLIAFEPDATPGWHPIELRTRNKDYVVRTRSGYVTPSRTGTH